MSEASDYRADLQDELALVGEALIIRRYSGTPKVAADTAARGKSLGYDADEIAGSATIAGRKFVVLVDTVVAAILPLSKADYLVRGAKEMRISHVDDEKRRVAGELVGLEIWTSGA